MARKAKAKATATATATATEKREVDWLHSEGRRLLFEDLRQKLYGGMHWRVVFQQRPEFDVGKTKDDAERLFQSRLYNARKISGSKDSRAAKELGLLQHDLQVRPYPLFNHRGEERWEGSETQKLLKQDIADKKHIGLTPTQFMATRPEYGALPRFVIKGHVEQEVRLQKFLKQYRAKFGF